MAKPMVKKGVQRILLCGFMGCGKTSVGQALSFRLKWEFLDTDAMIEKREGRKIPEIFAQDGEAAFRQMEAQTAASLGRRRNTVISTGGGFSDHLYLQHFLFSDLLYKQTSFHRRQKQNSLIPI